MDERIAVVYRDESLAVVDKPAGLMVHDSALARGERRFALDLLREQFGRRVYFGHRLDRATSGCLLLAFDPVTASRLGKAFMAREVDKDYLAVCRGWPAAETGIIDHPLDGGPGKPEKKPARTGWRVLARGELPVPSGGFDSSRFSLLLCRPETGRFRQIRRHLRHAGHHLLGDTSHGDGQRNRIFRLHLGVHRMLLHAWRLRFPHPADGRRLSVLAPPDADWRRVLSRFGWQWPDDASVPDF